MKLNNSEKADQLMQAKDKVWEKLDICCSWSSRKGNKKIGYSVKDKKKQHDALLIQKIKNLGYSEKNKVPATVRQILENENYHTLNRVLGENNLGMGNY